jgi:DNA-binding MarR family transcriptional regulator
MASSSGHDQLLEALLTVGAQLSVATMQYQQVVASRLEINVTDYGCLQVLIGNGAMTAGELAERLSLSAGAVTGVVDRLEAARFVRRVRDPADRRRVIVEPVEEEVERRVAPLFESIYGALSAKVQRFSEADLKLVLDYLSQSLATLRAETTRLQAVAREPGE